MQCMSKTPQPKDWHEARRLRAWELSQQNWAQKQIAIALGVSEGAVSQWIKRGREGGIEMLRNKPRPGAKPKLTAPQRAQLPELLARGAPAFSFIGDMWNQERIVAVTKREFGVSYHHDHISRLLRSIGWSYKKPIERISTR